MAALALDGGQLQALATVCECMKGLINVSNQPSSGPIQGTEAKSPVKDVGEAAQVLCFTYSKCDTRASPTPTVHLPVQLELNRNERYN